MKRTRFTEVPITGIRAGHEAGAKSADLCCKHGILEGPFYNWMAKFSGRSRVSQFSRTQLRPVHVNARKFQRICADLDLCWPVGQLPIFYSLTMG